MFAITAHIHSPRCYDFLRKKFNSHLPDISTIRKWYAKCTSNGEPGISCEGLSGLSLISNDLKCAGKNLYVSIAFDEMSIRKHVQWSDSRKQFMGFISHGHDKRDEGSKPLARNALVFLVSGINFDFHLPIAHSFITTLGAEEKSEIITQVVRAVTELGIKVVSITFDGLQTNFAACRRLGARFSIKNMKPFIVNPVDETKIYIVPDLCHMLKLLRNCLASQGSIEDSSGGIIQWKYLEKLVDLREKRDLVTHKMTKRHIQWDRAKMDVRIAAQTFSNSVSTSLNHLLKRSCDGFEGSESTIKFITVVDKLFDTLNSKNRHSDNAFKNPITKDNKSNTFIFFAEAEKYLKSLKLNGQDILTTRRNTGFLGFIVCMKSVKSIYDEYIETDKFEKLPTFNLSQDPLESLFSRVRYLNGCNDNPNVEQFMSAMRKLLIQNELISSKHANCKDELNILAVPSTSDTTRNQISFDFTDPQYDNEKKMLDDMGIFCPNDFLLDSCEEDTLSFIAGSIEHKIVSSAYFKCKSCESVLVENAEISYEFSSMEKVRVPRKSTVYICKVANKFFEIFKKNIHFTYNLLICKILQEININIDTIYEKTTFECNPEHKQSYIQYIVEEFVRRKANSEAKAKTLEQQDLMYRRKVKKLIHFKGQ